MGNTISAMRMSTLKFTDNHPVRYYILVSPTPNFNYNTTKPAIRRVLCFSHAAYRISLRMERHVSNAQTPAEFPQWHPALTEVLYPGLKSNRYMKETAMDPLRFHGCMYVIISLFLRQKNDLPILRKIIFYRNQV